MDDMQSKRARIRWRARRGLLENDLILTRFLDDHEKALTDGQVAALHELLKLDDNDLLDILLGIAEPQGDLDTPVIRQLVGAMRRKES